MRPKWLVWVAVVYIAIMAVQFLMAKLKDPVNPSGFLLPILENKIYGDDDSSDESESEDY